MADVTQYFLPIISERSGELLGASKFDSPVTFNGLEIEANFPGKGDYVLQKFTVDRFGVTSFYMAGIMPEGMVRSGSYASFVPNFTPTKAFEVVPHWYNLPGLSTKDLYQDQYRISNFFLNPEGGAAVAYPVIQNPTANTTGNVVWTVNTGFVNDDAYTFIDVDWMSLLSVQFPQFNPGSIVIQAPTPSSIETFVRAYVVQAANIQGSSPVYTNIRFVKVTGLEPAAGTYAYPVVISSRSGETVNATINLVVS